MTSLKKRALLLIGPSTFLVLAFWLLSSAQSQNSVDHPDQIFNLSERHYFEKNHSSKVIVVDNNYVWGATEVGLHRWIKSDPTDLRVFSIEDGLSGNNILDIEQAESGDIWVLSSSGLDLIASEKIIRFQSDIWAQLNIIDIEAGEGQVLFLLSESHVLKLENSVISDISPKFVDPTSNNNAYVDRANTCAVNNPIFPRYGKFDSIEYLEKGVLYAFGKLVPDCYLGVDGKWQAPSLNGSTLNLTSIAQDNDGSVWIGGKLPLNQREEYAIAKISTDFLVSSPYFSQIEVMPFSEIAGVGPGDTKAIAGVGPSNTKAIDFDENNNLWLFTNNVNVYDGEQWTSISNQPNVLDGSGAKGMILIGSTPWFYGNYIYSRTDEGGTLYINGLLSNEFTMRVDRSGNKWIFYLSERWPAFARFDGESLTHYLYAEKGYLFDSIVALDGITWFRSNSLSYFKEGSLTYIPVDQLPINGLQPHFVDDLGNTWFYSYYFDVDAYELKEYFYKYEGTTFSEFIPASKRPNNNFPAEQNELEELFYFQGNLWGFSNTRGFPFQYYDDQLDKWVNVEMPLTYIDEFNREQPINISKSIVRHDLGEIWLISPSGMAIYETGNWVLHEFPESIVDRRKNFDTSKTVNPEQMLTRNDKIWFIHKDGLLSFDGVNFQLHNYPDTLLSKEKASYFLDNIESVEVGNDGDVWINGRTNQYPWQGEIIEGPAYILFRDSRFSTINIMRSEYRAFGEDTLYGYDAYNYVFGVWHAFEPTHQQFLPMTQR